MEELKSFSDGSNCLMDNRIVVNANLSEMKGSTKISFFGRNNVLYVEDGVSLNNSTIRFLGNNSVIYLSQGSHPYSIKSDIYNNSVVYIGKNCYFNGGLHIKASEQQNIIIGTECLFSFGIFVRTADPHLIYDSTTKGRINPSASVFIGDHVWVGQDVLILKGTRIGSGSIVGGATCIAGKMIPSNVTIGGNPARIIRENVFFLPNCVHSWTDDVIEEYSIKETDEYIYFPTENTLEIAAVDSKLKAAQNVEERLNNVYHLLAMNHDRNRFAISTNKKEESQGIWERIRRGLSSLK